MVLKRVLRVSHTPLSLCQMGVKRTHILTYSIRPIAVCRQLILYVRVDWHEVDLLQEHGLCVLRLRTATGKASAPLDEGADNVFFRDCLPLGMVSSGSTAKC